MKKEWLCLLVAAVIVSLCGCAFLPLPDYMDTSILQQVQINGVTYQTGFYEDHHIALNVLSVEPCGNTDAGYEYAQVKGTPFDLIWALEDGYYGMGALYCREDQFDAAAAYYADPDNYAYKLFEGNPADMDADLEYPMPDLDMEKYRALKEFENTLYQSEVPFYTIPFQNGDRYAGEYYFQIISKDGYIVENYGMHYRVADGKLVIVRTLGVQYGTVEVVDVPKELSDYFVQFLMSK
jgi:hypothetical protein